MRKHIAVITTSFPDGEPGSEAAGSFVEDLVEALAKDVCITVLAPGRCSSIEYRGNISVRRFPVPSLPLSLLKPYNPLHWPSIIRTLWLGEDEIKLIVAEKKVDHVLALWALPSGYWAKSVYKSQGIPYSTWVLGSDIWSLRNIPLVKRVLAGVLRDGHECFADGYRLKQDVEEISGRSCKFLVTSRNLPIVEKKQLSSSPPYKLAFLGRWHHNKGVDLMIESLGLLNDMDWDNIEEVRICGGGPLEEKVRSGCDSLKKAGRPVTLDGYLNKTQAVELLTWTDYLLIPSRIESIPLVFSDAMHAGCPVIATPVGDLPRLLGENIVGVLAGGVSPNEFADAIRSGLSASSIIYRDGLEEMCTKLGLQRTVDRLLCKFEMS